METTKMKQMMFENVDISLIAVGDLIEHDNKIQTVCKKHIGGDRFIGRTLFGDSYNLGYKKVKRVKRNNSGCVIYNP